MAQKYTSRFIPLILTLLIVVSDQLSKAWVVATIPENTVGFRYLGDFLALVHVRNTAIAFSMGDELPIVVKLLFFIIVPVLLVVAVCIVYFSRKIHLSTFQRWVLALFLGGGIGNLIDRIFRSFRVVDFISVKVYGFLGFERWPTWNIADASLVISGILLAVSLLFESSETKEDNNV
ncbi:MAG: signal peptidase [Sphaerochaeta sp.]|jgi:signal peptidase II|uniref:Lipoprotein signal peptidase n=1 Tax=Sphaerochaeta halotolerans TaxID=2293840 RepID=A0A372MGH1_9SPIR|nr:signal peptidase II [Sphaerochaeta halotolerans]MDK2860549.1 signal peptidase [Sphaerochaeta sp.]RFU94280.1 signal peptidase II [Sphaerochaeta halotolerans]